MYRHGDVKNRLTLEEIEIASCESCSNKDKDKYPDTKGNCKNIAIAILKLIKKVGYIGGRDMKKKSKIHTHHWTNSVNQQCPFCGADMKLCISPNCYLYMCKNSICKQIIQIKRI